MQEREDLLSVPELPNSIFPLWPNLPLMWHGAPLIFSSMMMQLVQMSWQSFTLYQFTQAVGLNLTFNEMENGHRYHYMKDPAGRPYNPFDSDSFERNFHQWLHPSIDYFTYYFLRREDLV